MHENIFFQNTFRDHTFIVQRMGAHRDQKLAVDNKTTNTMLRGQEFYGFNLRIYFSTRYKNHRVEAS